MPPFVEKSRTLRVGNPERYRLCVLSDTHGRPHPNLLDLVAGERPHAMLHAGDVGEMLVLDELQSIAPVLAVRGNMDARSTGMPEALRVTLRHNDTEILGIYLTHVAVYGARLQTSVHRAASDAQADLVVCGHSHVPLIVRSKELAVFNPGSCGPRRYGLPITYGMLELTEDGARMRHVDCETGDRWRPPSS